MIIVTLSDLARVHGGRTIFSKLSWSIQDREKIGLVGPNGIGKSTLLRTMAGLELPDAGNMSIKRGLRIAYLPQEYSGDPERGVMAELLDARSDLAELEARIDALETQLGEPEVANDLAVMERILTEHERLISQHEALGGPQLRGKVEELLNDLELDESHWYMPMKQLSGGQRKLVGLARCLLADPELLLLDEPDNHLDMTRKRMLEKLIRSFDGAVVIVSHDRYLLDETVSTITELEPARDTSARIITWEGNYSAYAIQKELALLKQQQDYTAQQKEISQIEEAIARFKLWAHMVDNARHARQARNKEHLLDRMERIERPVLERRRMALQFRPKLRGGDKAVELRNLSKSFEERRIFAQVQATVMNGERVGIVGPNGIGKSVLLRMILGQFMPDSGEVWIGPSMRLGYYAQQHETLDMRQTPIEAVREVQPMYEGEAVAKLGRFLIPYDACSQPIGKLSGGEKSRVQLACLMLAGVNCLMLDEPTNNLDIPSAEVLEKALDEFSGTVVVVSHDRYFLDRIADRIFEIDNGRLRVYEGGYSYYAEQKEREQRRPEPPLVSAKQTTRPPHKKMARA